MEFHHVPIMLQSCIEALSIKPSGIYVDGTMGGGGHSRAIATNLQSGGRLIGIDRDTDAINAAKARLSEFNNVTYVHSNYADIKDILKDLNIQSINGALLDLGVSSFQLDNAERGFSYMQDAPLDMRMNRQDKLSAFHVINEYSIRELHGVIREYGEEKWAKRIAQFVIEARAHSPIQTTFELNNIIKKAVPASARREGPHPSKRTFQALRIEVNGELEKLRQAVYDFFDVLAADGILAIITFHSLEDRIVKQVFADLASGCNCPKEFPICVCGKQPRATVKKQISPTEEEIENNPRARSARLRVARKVEKHER